MKQLLVIVATIAALYLLMGQSNAAAPQTQQDGPGCAEAYRQAYSAQWAEMNQLQRLAVGLQASGECAP